VLAGVVVALSGVGTPAGAQTRPVNIVVIGDSLADGLWGGLWRELRGNRRYRVIRETLNSSGFTSYNFEARLQQVVTKYRVDVLVIQVGANDRQRMVVRRPPFPTFLSEKWMEIYRKRIDRFAGLVKKYKLRGVWVGLPNMRKEKIAQDSKLFNEIYREMAKKHGLVYVSTWEVTSDETGSYKAFITTDKGRKRRFRADDGIHFSTIGYDAVAERVLSVMRQKFDEIMSAKDG
jgi:hypothetical protein